MMMKNANTTRINRSKEWRSKLVIAVTGILLFETLTGLSIYFLPFSIPNQMMVLLHTVFGLLFVAPFVWYQIRHWLLYRRYTMTHTVLTGYLGMGVAVICVISGVVLTWQSFFGYRISYAWDLVHLLSTFAVIGFTVPHILLIVWRDRQSRAREEKAVSDLGEGRSPGVPILSGSSPLRAAQKRYGWGMGLIALACFGVTALCIAIYKPVKFVNELPADYHYVYGDDRPFAPSLARTVTNRAFDARSLSGSETCGTTRCHEQIVKEWSVSTHRYAAMDTAFQAIQEVMGKQNGPESTRYCGGCHDPISLFSGTKNIFTDNLTALQGYQEGVSCLACHAIHETDLKGNANYVITQPKRYMFELNDEAAGARFLRDFLLRAYPRYHVESLSKRLFKTPDYCAACHKQFIDQEVNNVGWVQLQNQYDNWRKSRWNHPGDPKKTIECRECHMPLEASTDPAAGDSSDYNRTANDKKHRSHRFIAANQFMPALLKLPGADEQIALTQKWLRGEYDIPEIEHKWAKGPIVSLELVAPKQVTPGESVRVKAVITSNKVGHDFPTGPLDIIQSWVELVVKDDQGNVVYQSGTVDAEHFIQKGSFIFKAEPVDQYGNLIDRHNLWEMVGVRFRRSLFPGFSDSAEYTFACPSSVPMKEIPTAQERTFDIQPPKSVGGTLHVSAKLRYRKIDQYLLNFMFGKEAGITTPITDISEAQTTIQLVKAL
jgi:hypothetical protein